jgi:MAM domain, meprin/A5/mu
MKGENICDWTHDPDHDFDFERRSGYNNKTIGIVTGPHADHTTGIPFQGHYMVINTNTEVYTKSARLISPLYRITAQTVCFRFYYHMYGYGLGTLRVYAKPESVELEDVLVQDTEMEARSKYVVFEMKGLSWKIAFFLVALEIVDKFLISLGRNARKRLARRQRHHRDG